MNNQLFEKAKGKLSTEMIPLNAFDPNSELKGCASCNRFTRCYVIDENFIITYICCPCYESLGNILYREKMFSLQLLKNMNIPLF